jgi:hypothetical protein
VGSAGRAWIGIYFALNIASISSKDDLFYLGLLSLLLYRVSTISDLTG